MHSVSIHAAGVWVTDAQGLVLAFRRSDSGRLGLPFGRVDPGEAPSAAAARECLEETGLAVALTGEAPFISPTPGGKPGATYRATLTGERRTPTHPEEGHPEWVTVATLLADTGFPAYMRGVVAHFGAPPPG